MDFRDIGSTWFEGGLPIPPEYLKVMVTTGVYSIDASGTRARYDVTFFATDAEKVARAVARGKELADRNLPPLILVAHVKPKDAPDEQGTVYWTNLAEYALSFLLQRIGVERDIQDGFDKL